MRTNFTLFVQKCSQYCVRSVIFYLFFIQPFSHNAPPSGILWIKGTMQVLLSIFVSYFQLYSFLSFTEPLPPGAPQNLTEGDTKFEDGRLTVKVHWDPPKKSDLPVARYKVNIEVSGLQSVQNVFTWVTLLPISVIIIRSFPYKYGSRNVSGIQNWTVQQSTWNDYSIFLLNSIS